MSEYIPSPSAWVAEQVELYEGSNGKEGTTLIRDGRIASYYCQAYGKDNQCY